MIDSPQQILFLTAINTHSHTHMHVQVCILTLRNFYIITVVITITIYKWKSCNILIKSSATEETHYILYKNYIIL